MSNNESHESHESHKDDDDVSSVARSDDESITATVIVNQFSLEDEDDEDDEEDEEDEDDEDDVPHFVEFETGRFSMDSELESCCSSVTEQQPNKSFEDDEDDEEDEYDEDDDGYDGSCTVIANQFQAGTFPCSSQPPRGELRRSQRIALRGLSVAYEPRPILGGSLLGHVASNDDSLEATYDSITAPAYGGDHETVPPSPIILPLLLRLLRRSPRLALIQPRVHYYGMCYR
jgi:hypothetical protein